MRTTITLAEVLGAGQVLLGRVQKEARDDSMIRTILSVLFAIGTAQSAHAATLRVPQDHKTIQAAIDASDAGDTILVA